MNVDKIIYINLAAATERNENMKKTLSHFPAEKVMRFEAITNDKGYIGCSQSHIECLKLAIENNWKNVLILEDDAEFTRKGEHLQELLTNPYDVILLGGTFHKVDSNHRVTSACTTTAYIVNNHYYSTLLNNFTEGLQKLIETDIYETFAIDQFWKQLQQKDRWFLVHMIIQTPGYSYIQKTYVDYTPYF